MEDSSTQEVSHHCVVPDWNLPTSHQHQGQTLTHVKFQPTLTTSTHPFHFPPQMHITTEVGGIIHGGDMNGVHVLPPMPIPMPMPPPVKPRWGSCDTLESIVRQATRHDIRPPKPEDDGRTRLRSCTENHRKVMRSPGLMPPSQVVPRKRSCASEPVVRRKNARLSMGTCVSGSSTFNMREDDSNTMTTTKLTEEDYASQDESGSKDEEGEGRGGTGRVGSRCSRQSKAATTTTHNLSERRRRDRINEKMKALQKMVPNSSKTDKASMLDEVIVYMKQLQAQVEMMKLMRSNVAAVADDNINVPQMMNAMMTVPPAALPLPQQQQQQLQMSLLARMGIGLGLGMLGHANSAAAANNAFVAPTVPQPHLPPHFLMPGMIPAAAFTTGHLNPNVGGPLAPMPLHDPYAAFLARKISIDNYYNKLAAIHQQRIRHHHPIRSDKAQRQ